MSWSDYTKSPAGQYERGLWDGMYRAIEIFEEFSTKIEDKEQLIDYVKRYISGQRVEDV